MSETVNLVVLTTRDLNMSLMARAYELEQGVSHSITGSFFYEALPDANHYRASLFMEVEGKSIKAGEEVDVLSASSQVEAVFRYIPEGELTTEGLENVVIFNIGPALLGQVRVNLSMATQQIGIPPVVLPPLDPVFLKRLLPSSEGDSEGEIPQE